MYVYTYMYACMYLLSIYLNSAMNDTGLTQTKIRSMREFLAVSVGITWRSSTAHTSNIQFIFTLL